MKSIGDPRCYPSKRTEDHGEPCGHVDGKGKHSSWQRSVKRKLPSSACELPPQARKQDNALCNLQSSRRPRQLASVRKSLSDPLQVFGDGDGNNDQHRTFSGNNPPEFKDKLPRDHQGQHEAVDVENLSRERRRGLKPGLKDSTNLDPKVSLKQSNLHTYNEVLVLKEALRAEKEAHRAVQAELEEERNASSTAANEAMSMIARLQEEKAAVLMEARQFKRMAEERELHNQEAISLLKEMLLNKEEEALALENELVICRNMFLAIEAGEPVQNLMLKYIDAVDNSNRNGETEMVSGHIEEGLTNWTGFVCESKQLSICADGFATDTVKEEPINSEFTGRTFSRSFKGFTSDNVRGNLEAFFNKTEQMTEDMPKCNDVQCSREVPGKTYDRTIGSSKSADVQESPFVFTQSALHRIRDSDSLEQTAQLSAGKGYLECRTEPPVCCTDEQSRSLWDRIMKLEHRLETFGVDGGQGFEFDLPGNVAVSPQTPGFTSCKQQVGAGCWVPTSHCGTDSQAVCMKKAEFTERPRKLQCKDNSQVPEPAMRQSTGSEISFCQNQSEASLGFPGRNSSDMSEQPCNDIAPDAVEGVHDIYEVASDVPQNLCCKFPGADNGCEDQTNSVEKPASPLELMKPVMETMVVTPPDSVGVRNLSSSLSGAEVQQLNLRLQVLENEKHSMHQAILSLQAENKELRMMQEIALQLEDLNQSQNLKRNMQTSEHPSKRVKSEQPSFTSLLKGFLSYLPSSTSLEDRSLTFPPQELGSGSIQRDHVGLSHLLQKSPHLKTDTLIVRDLKVKVPAAI